MNKILLLILSQALILTAPNMASADQSIADTARQYVPASLISRFDEYFTMIGINSTTTGSLVGNNQGLANYYRHLRQQNQCFSQLYENFLAEINQPRPGDAPPNRIIYNTENTNEQSGWLWERAMAYAGGNSNLAMSLIGTFGHDDIILHPDHPAYRTGSLGASTILPQHIVDQTVSIQAPNAGGEVLRSKYYHTIGAAILTCSLVRNGVPGFAISRVQAAAARTYRMYRLCHFMEGEDSNHLTQATRQMRQLLTEGRNIDSILNEILTTPEAARFQPNAHNLDLIFTFLWNHKIDPTNRQLVREKLEMLAGNADAISIFKASVLRPGDSCLEPQITSARVNRMQVVARGRGINFCGEIPRDRCQQAKQRLLTWWADIEWTEAQHREGAEFAINNCEADPNFNDRINELSCAQLGAETSSEVQPPQRAEP